MRDKRCDFAWQSQPSQCAGREAQRYASVKDTQTQMRHADPSVTLRFYQKPILESVREAFTAMKEDLFAEAEKAEKGTILQ